MVTVVLRGGLGNQMFQYAAGLSLALKNNTELVLDTTYLNDRFPRREITFRTYDLDIFRVEPRFTLLSKISSALPIPGLWLALDLGLMKIKNMFGVKKIVNEKVGLEFDPEILKAGNDVVLWGFWQTGKYFDDIAEKIKEQFRFKHVLEGKAAEFAEMIKKDNSVALHVRRGDYVQFSKVKSSMGDTNLNYYRDAMAYMGKYVENPHFFLFSDDMEWCKENMKAPFPITYMEHDVDGPKFSYYLELMTLCKHIVIANSTFSWWAAWLNQNPKKIVVAPKRWQADVRIREEIIPEGWIRI